ncbi:ribbon-helix-helix protein, CopG family [Mycobacterium sp. SMC-18]|uniref:ribbon-helix-helix protein, CopG family n=1 Tax=Mycobacterium sp. SMC-18 TaxID=3381629 RepID=UPI0038761BE0
MADTAGLKKRPSGSENRRRTDTISLRLLPGEGAALSALAEKRGHSSRAELIRDALERLVTAST